MAVFIVSSLVRQGVYPLGWGTTVEGLESSVSRVSQNALNPGYLLEIKGQDTEQNRAKRSALGAWVKAVNEKGGFGSWAFDVAFEPAEIHDIIAKNIEA